MVIVKPTLAPASPSKATCDSAGQFGSRCPLPPRHRGDCRDDLSPANAKHFWPNPRPRRTYCDERGCDLAAHHEGRHRTANGHEFGAQPAPSKAAPPVEPAPVDLDALARDAAEAWWPESTLGRHGRERQVVALLDRAVAPLVAELARVRGEVESLRPFVIRGNRAVEAFGRERARAEAAEQLLAKREADHADNMKHQGYAFDAAEQEARHWHERATKAERELAAQTDAAITATRYRFDRLNEVDQLRRELAALRAAARAYRDEAEAFIDGRERPTADQYTAALSDLAALLSAEGE